MEKIDSSGFSDVLLNLLSIVASIPFSVLKVVVQRVFLLNLVPTKDLLIVFIFLLFGFSIGFSNV